MAAGLVYRSAWLYDLLLRVLYGRHYAARDAAIAALVPPGARVLDLCCGPGFLYQRHLRARGVEYTGLDLNARFVARVERLGACGLVWDLSRDEPLPEADVVVMQGSLYHFLPDPRPVLDRMLHAARSRVIVAEPIRNLAGSRSRLTAALAARLTAAGQGDQPLRFTEESLDRLLGPIAARGGRSFLIPGGREKVYVLDAAGAQAAHAGREAEGIEATG